MNIENIYKKKDKRRHPKENYYDGEESICMCMYKENEWKSFSYCVVGFKYVCVDTI